MTDISGHLGDPGAVSRDDAIFLGEILRLDVNFRPKISRRPKMSRRLTAPGSPRMTFFSATERAYRESFLWKYVQTNIFGNPTGSENRFTAKEDHLRKSD